MPIRPEKKKKKHMVQGDKVIGTCRVTTGGASINDDPSAPEAVW